MTSRQKTKDKRQKTKNSYSGLWSSVFGLRSGFTLMELMVTVAILAIGILMVQEGLLRSADLMGRYQSTLRAQVWAGEKMWGVREGLLYSDDAGPPEESEFADTSGKIFSCAQIVETLPAGRELYTVGLAVAWNEGGRHQVLKREMYAAKPIDQTKI